MIGFFDAHYTDTMQAGALVFVKDWPDEKPYGEAYSLLPYAPAVYQPGEFWRRELPILRWLLESPQDPYGVAFPKPPIRDLVDILVIDGFVDLGPDRPGFGRKAHEAFNVPVVGVAKSYFLGAHAIQVTRGKSKRPLYVTSAGIDPYDAALRVGAMHGKDRLPTMIKLVDKLARSVAGNGNNLTHA